MEQRKALIGGLAFLIFAVCVPEASAEKEGRSRPRSPAGTSVDRASDMEVDDGEGAEPAESEEAKPEAKQKKGAEGKGKGRKGADEGGHGWVELPGKKPSTSDIPRAVGPAPRAAARPAGKKGKVRPKLGYGLVFGLRDEMGSDPALYGLGSRARWKAYRKYKTLSHWGLGLAYAGMAGVAASLGYLLIDDDSKLSYVLGAGGASGVVMGLGILLGFVGDHLASEQAEAMLMSGGSRLGSVSVVPGPGGVAVTGVFQ
jgi:hypothetical protein